MPKLARKDLDPEFLNFVEEKWNKYERASKKADFYHGTTKSLFWRKKAYEYRFDYDIAMLEYDARVARDGGVKLEEK